MILLFIQVIADMISKETLCAMMKRNADVGPTVVHCSITEHLRCPFQNCPQSQNKLIPEYSFYFLYI